MGSVHNFYSKGVLHQKSRVYEVPVLQEVYYICKMPRLKEVPNVAELYYICVSTRRGAKTSRGASIIRGVLHQESRLEEVLVLRGALHQV